VPRPSPGYPAITSAFYAAMDNIIKGADPQTELDAAVDKIDQDIEDNDGYPVQ
jgi:multiple sugar transport system substrate-binding protein